MTELQELTGSGDSVMVEDLTLSPPRLIEWAEAETEAARHFLRTVSQAASELGETARQAVYARAVDNLKNEPLAFGSAGFDAWAMSASALPYLLWLSARVRQPAITRNGAAQFLVGERGESIARAVWDLWGYRDSKKKRTRSSMGDCDGAESSAGSPAADAAGITAKSPT